MLLQTSGSAEPAPSVQRQVASDGADLLLEQFGEVARSLQAQAGTGAMLDEVVAAAIRLIPGA